MEIQSVFTKHRLTLEETLAAVNYSDLQRKFLQTQLAEVAEAKLRLKVDPQNIESFIQQEAEYAGQITLLEYLLGMYDSMINSQTNEG